MSRLRDWWHRLTGRETAARAAPRPVPKVPDSAKPVPGELGILDEPIPKKPSRTGAAGFDPYASDAGFAKPHSWERVDHD